MSFFRLIRIGNLAIIAVTMLGVWTSITKEDSNGFMGDFILLICFTLLVAAAGNTINDYFDYKSDRLNKPERLIIEKTIKKRWAIIIHWGFNLIALLISLYLSWHINSWFYVFIHVFATSLLWYYSVTIKRMLFWSNFLISFLVALVPLITLKFVYDTGSPNTSHLYMIIIISAFAFVINFAREVIKDIQDMEGDKLRRIQSFALVFGKASARKITSITLATLIPIYLIGYFIHAFPSHLWFNLLFIGGMTTGMFGIVLIIFNAAEKNVNLILKLSLLLGSCSIYFL